MLGTTPIRSPLPAHRSQAAPSPAPTPPAISATCAPRPTFLPQPRHAFAADPPSPHPPPTPGNAPSRWPTPWPPKPPPRSPPRPPRPPPPPSRPPRPSSRPPRRPGPPPWPPPAALPLNAFESPKATHFDSPAKRAGGRCQMQGAPRSGRRSIWYKCRAAASLYASESPVATPP